MGVWLTSVDPHLDTELIYGRRAASKLGNNGCEGTDKKQKRAGVGMV